MIDDFVAQANQLPGEFSQNLSLERYNSWRVGGPGEYVYLPKSIEDLQQFISIIPNDMPITWLGLGSNTLIRDGGVKGAVIVTQGRMSTIEVRDDNRLYAEAGASCAQVARFGARNNLTGAEFLAGVPGTMGGALAMNAGCFGSETWEFIESVTMLTREGKLQTLTADAFEIGYRSVARPVDGWFISAVLKLTPGVKEESLGKIRVLLDSRAASQPTGEHSCGSVFRNPANDYSGRLVEACGLKDYHIGGAKVSPKHANFILNTGAATAAEIEELIFFVQKQVNDKFGVELKCEVKVIGQLATGVKNGQAA